jgi:hypothetical protein
MPRRWLPGAGLGLVALAALIALRRGTKDAADAIGLAPAAGKGSVPCRSGQAKR